MEPYFSEFIEKLKPDIERLRLSNEFGVKIYNRLVKQYPLLASDAARASKANSGHYSAKKGKDSGSNSSLSKQQPGPVKGKPGPFPGGSGQKRKEKPKPPTMS